MSTATHPSGRLPVVVVGAGQMGRSWLRMLANSPDAVAVGLVDLDVALAEMAVADTGLRDVFIGVDLLDVASRSGAQAVINVTVPLAHRHVNETALRAGLPVLCEKPLAPDLPGALQQVALADVTGGLLMVSQSRRYFPHLDAFRVAVRSLGPLAVVTSQFLHEDHEPGFREEMAHPLLVDMSIHHFDMLRSLVDDEPVAVRCTAWNPPWSWFRGMAAATAEFELRSGARFVYAGSRATPGLSTSWNGEWRVHGERGAAWWDGDECLRIGADTAEAPDVDGPNQIATSVRLFADALRSRTTPDTEVRHNVLSLAMVEGAIRSSENGGDRVLLADLLEEALVAAIATESRSDVSGRLRSWTSAADGISRGAWPGTEPIKGEK